MIKSKSIRSRASAQLKLLTRPQVLERVPSPQELKRLLASGWLMPVRSGRCSLFDSASVDKVVDRIRKGELPPLMPAELRAGRRRKPSESVYKAVEVGIRSMVAKMHGADPSRRKLMVESSADGLITISPRIENRRNPRSSK